jgi:hypothetical protein
MSSSRRPNFLSDIPVTCCIVLLPGPLATPLTVCSIVAGARWSHAGSAAFRLLALLAVTVLDKDENIYS